MINLWFLILKPVTLGENIILNEAHMRRNVCSHGKIHLSTIFLNSLNNLKCKMKQFIYISLSPHTKLNK